MNKLSLAAYAVLDLAKTTACDLFRRTVCLIRREPFRPYVHARGPQWQQLELPFSRTPVTRWNR